MQSLAADTMIFDLEDGVPPGLKENARINLLQTLSVNNNISSSRKCEFGVRVNSLESGLLDKDLETLSLLQPGSIDCVILPKCQSSQDLFYLRSRLSTMLSGGEDGKISIFACMESARSFVNLADIAEKGKRQFGVSALVYSAEDFCADMNLVRTAGRSELLYSRSALVTYAKAWGLDAIDMVCLDFRNEPVLVDECQEGWNMGFTGKQAIHPSQIAVINRHYSPAEKELVRARNIVAMYEKLALQEDKAAAVGAFDYEGKVIDLPVVKQMQKILKRHELSLSMK